MNYDDHDQVLETLKKDQHAEEDLREEIDDVIHFLNHPQGQWEDAIWNEFDGRPRYTFDQCNPAIGKVWSEMAANEYSASCQPAGDGASEDVSNILDGMFRNSYNISSFDNISTRSGKRMIASGLAGWRIVSKYCNDKSFYQDLMQVPITNFHRRVWFDCNAELQTKEDAEHVFQLSSVAKAKADKMADRPVMCVDDYGSTDSYAYKPQDQVKLGEILYKKRTKSVIYMLDDEDFSVVEEEELAKKGLTPEDALESRDVECVRVYSRKFDGAGWIGKAKETVFSYLPIIPEYANYDISEDGKTTYRGLVRQVMDHQRVFNYSESRKVEESVLAPRRKIMVDNRVAEGYEDEFGNINRDPRAVQMFNGKGADSAKIPFFETQGPAPNPAVSEVSNDMIRNMQLSLGLPNELETIQKTSKDSDNRFNTRNSMGQVGTFEYYKAHQVALEHTAKVMLDAIPRVYDTERKVRVIDESNQSSDVEINKTDRATGETLNDLKVGRYDVVINMGKDFESRQADANTAILELGSVNPDVVVRNTDIIANNIKAPGMRTVADREREYLFKQGAIPEEQWTNEEKEKVAQAQAQAQGQQEPDPATVIAQAEMAKAQAETDKVQTQLLIEQAKLEQKQLEMQMKGAKEGYDLQLKEQQQQIDELTSLIQGAKTLAEIDQMNANSQELARQNALIGQEQADI